MSYVYEKTGARDIVEGIGGALKDVERAVWRPVGGALEDVADKAFTIVDNIVSDPKKLLIVGLSIAFPGAATAIGNFVLPASMAGGTVATIVGNTFLNTVTNGGNVEEALKSSLIQAGASELTSNLKVKFASEDISKTLTDIAAKTTTDVALATVLGKDPTAALLFGGVQAATQVIADNVLGSSPEIKSAYDKLPSLARDSLTAGISAALAGKDVSGAVAGALVNGAIRSFRNGVALQDKAIKLEGAPLDDQRLAELSSVEGVTPANAGSFLATVDAVEDIYGQDVPLDAIAKISNVYLDAPASETAIIRAIVDSKADEELRKYYNFGTDSPAFITAEDVGSIRSEIYGNVVNEVNAKKEGWDDYSQKYQAQNLYGDAITPGQFERLMSYDSVITASGADQDQALRYIEYLRKGWDPTKTEEENAAAADALLTSTVENPDGSQSVYDQDNNLVDIVPAPDQPVTEPVDQDTTTTEPDTTEPADQVTQPSPPSEPDGGVSTDTSGADTQSPDALVPDASNPNLEPGKTPQERAAEEWQRYLDSLENKPADLKLPGSTIEAGPYWDEYNANLKRIMDEGGYTSQWQKAGGDRVFVNDDGTAIGINENGGTYSLSDTEVEDMVRNGVLNTADSGYVDATGGEGDTPGGTDRCGEGFHWDEARQMCVPDDDEEPESQECPEGYVYNLTTKTCEPVSNSTSGGGGGGGGGQPAPVPQPRRTTPEQFFNQMFGMGAASEAVSRAIPDEPMSKVGLPIYERMDKFEGPLDQFLKMVSGGSYVSKPAQQPQQAPNMNMPMQPDRLDQQPGYFNYGRDTNIDQNLFGAQNSLNYDQQLFGGQNAPNYDQQLFSQPSPFKSGGLATPLMAAGGTTRYGRYAGGGLNVVEHSGKQRLDFRSGAAVTGPGDGQSDDIPAMLADGEFVFPADVVAALGNGSTKAGSDKLYDMMHAIRAHHRSAKPKDLPPPAKKSPLDYLKKPARKARG